MPLHDIHNSLYAHFSELAESRRVSNSPVFAIEHGITPDGIIQLKQAVQDHLSTSVPNENDWLAWVVYATEIGYEFEGHEYWQTFEEVTEKWKVRGERDFIRRCFRKFVQSFNGFTPGGDWANHFNIIAFPITHSILPKDFQFQFSEVLYELRSFISSSLINSPRLLGKKISENCFQQSKRFQRFAQNFDLVGLIAREVLTVDELGSGDVILASSFSRIIEDLRKRDQAAFFVDQTLSAIKDRSLAKAKRSVELHPALNLRLAGGGVWDVLIEVPDLQQLSDVSIEAEQFLTTARPRISGAMGGARLARGRLANYGPVQQLLESLPGDQSQLIHFRRELPSSIEEFFKKKFVLNLTKTVLFRKQVGGVAVQTDSAELSSKYEYMILSRSPLRSNDLLRPLETSCSNASIYLLNSEQLSNSAYEDTLLDLNLRLDAGFEFVPIAPYPLNLIDGTRLEYLDGDTPCFGIKIDKSWKVIRLQLEEFDLLDLENTSGEEFVFFSLPALSTGMYNLSYSVQYHTDREFEDLGKVSIYVKDRSIWRAGTSVQNALIVLLDPPKPSFELLQDGNVEFDVLCPNSPTKVLIRLLPKNPSEQSLFSKVLTTVSLPLEIAKVKECTDKLFADPNILELLERADLCQLEFNSDDLGSVNLDFRRELSPLRWDLQTKGDNVMLNVSETGDDIVTIDQYKFETPDVAVKIAFEDCFPDYLVPNDGGLFVAITPQQTKGIVILKNDSIKSFKSFADIGKDDGFKPEYRTWSRTKEDLTSLIKLYSLWSTSRAVGGIFSKKDLNKVLDGFISKIVCLADNYKWKRYEEDYLKEPNNRLKKQTLLFQVSQKSSITAALRDLALPDQLVESLIEKLTTIFKNEVSAERLVKAPKSKQIAAVIKTIRLEWFIEFALRLCSQPNGLMDWCETEEKYEMGLRKMLDNPILVRAARFMTLTLRSKGWYKWDWE